MKVSIYESRTLKDIVEIVSQAIAQKKFITIFGRCRVIYEGRSASKLGYGDRLVIIKPDGAVLVHRPKGYSPVNWQPDSKIIEATVREGELLVKSIREKPREILEIIFREVHLVVVVDEMTDSAEFVEYLDEHEIRDYIVRHPEIVEKGLHVITVEKPLQPGFVDIYARDSKGRIVVIEVKRVHADRNAVIQLYKYVEALRKHNPKAEIRGILVAPSASRQAMQLLHSLGLEYRKIDVAKIYQLIRRERSSRKEGILSFFAESASRG